MKAEHGLLMYPHEVRAVLDDRQIRFTRVIKPQPVTKDKEFQERPEIISDGTLYFSSLYLNIKCPYGKVGDKLWVRESWRCTGGGSLRNIIYRAEGDSAMSFCGIDDGRSGILHVPESHWAEWDRLVYKTNKSCNWRSPIHMYKWVARLWLEVTGVRVERVQDITHGDMRREGIEGTPCGPGLQDYSYEKEFAELWDSINKKRGYGWDKNPWVWVIEFRRIAE